MIVSGFYMIKDKFFDDMEEPYLKGNKEGNRPHYYCFEDINTGFNSRKLSANNKRAYSESN